MQHTVLRQLFIRGLFIMAPLMIYSQSSFVFKYSTINDEWPSDVIQTSDGGFIVSAAIGTFFNQYQTLLIRLSASGDSVKTLKISEPNGYCVITDLVKLDNGLFVGIGQIQFFSGEYKLWLVRFTDSLTVISSKYYALDYSLALAYFNCGFIDYQRNLIIYGAAAPTDTTIKNHVYIYQFTQDGDSLFFHYYRVKYGQLPSSMIQKIDSSGFYIAITGHFESLIGAASQILTLDNSFNVINVDSVPNSYALYLNLKYTKTNRILLTGKKIIDNSNPRTDKLGIQKLDTSFQTMSEFLSGPDDTISYPAYYTNLDFIDTSKIFYGGIVNQSIGMFPSSPTYILLNQFDTSLNLIFQRYYGGDINYMVWAITATSDGGCIIAAASYDWLTQNQERDIYILKVDSNVIITGINNPPPVRNQESSVYPNPGNNIINVETKNENSIFNLYDMTGRLTYNTTLLPGKNEIAVQHLKQGLYIYKIIGNSEVKGYGK